MEFTDISISSARSVVERFARAVRLVHGFWHKTEQRPLFTFMEELVPNKETYAPNENGYAFTIANNPMQVIDIVIQAKPCTFVLESIMCGGVNMLLGCGGVSADVFAPSVQNRFVRFTTLKRGQMLFFKFRRLAGEGAESILIAVKVRAAKP